jgi:hypothetical protein
MRSRILEYSRLVFGFVNKLRTCFNVVAVIRSSVKNNLSNWACMRYYGQEGSTY